ncbi:MAG TPA: proton-conducting transporter membrane subunit [Verrucomicrobiae bacterium]|nr:proton-conducting transporter membrane subunit [Verrucomicrobiae bacterium]
MFLLLFAVGILVLSGLAALWRPRLGIGGLVTACVIGLVSPVRVLAGGAGESLRLAWNVPYGAFFVQLDALSAFFLIPIFGLSALTAIYGDEYLAAWRGKNSLGASWFFFNLLVASMVMVVVARNAILFLTAWELMALTSFFLVTFEDETESVRDAGWTYLVASHLGTAFLLAMFILLGRQSGSLDFNRFAPVNAGALFLLAVVGFGTKAGFMPFHVWLPEAHPAAPSHVSALMSGVMIKMGIYGLLRTLMFLGPPPLWWGWLLVAIGLSSGVLGVLFALAQHDLKRLLAYHSVENIGIIALGLGVGLLGISSGSMPLAVLGFAGALLHVVNHALFKGLLFLGAGAVIHATGTQEIEHLGGLSKRMPWTAATFLIGAVAISGLPPLNGFVSEFLIYLGSYAGAVHNDAPVAIPLLGVIAGLALIGGLAAACFAKAFGIVFLGEPRHDRMAQAREPGLMMRLPMALLAAGCVLIGLLAPFVVKVLPPVLAELTRLSVADGLADAVRPLTLIVFGSAGFIVLVGGLLCLRCVLLAGRAVETTVTWDCGYGRPTPRMQYTASSFAQPLMELFAPVVRTRRKFVAPTGIFPQASSLATETPDMAREAVFRPLFAGIGWTLGRLRWLQQGRIQLYVLYIALTLLVLLIWKLA